MAPRAFPSTAGQHSPQPRLGVRPARVPEEVSAPHQQRPPLLRQGQPRINFILVTGLAFLRRVHPTSSARPSCARGSREPSFLSRPPRRIQQRMDLSPCPAAAPTLRMPTQYTLHDFKPSGGPSWGGRTSLSRRRAQIAPSPRARTKSQKIPRCLASTRSPNLHSDWVFHKTVLLKF